MSGILSCFNMRANKLLKCLVSASRYFFVLPSTCKNITFANTFNSRLISTLHQPDYFMHVFFYIPENDSFQLTGLANYTSCMDSQCRTLLRGPKHRLQHNYKEHTPKRREIKLCELECTIVVMWSFKWCTTAGFPQR